MLLPPPTEHLEQRPHPSGLLLRLRLRLRPPQRLHLSAQPQQLPHERRIPQLVHRLRLGIEILRAGGSSGAGADGSNQPRQDRLTKRVKAPQGARTAGSNRHRSRRVRAGGAGAGEARHVAGDLQQEPEGGFPDIAVGAPEGQGGCGRVPEPHHWEGGGKGGGRGLGEGVNGEKARGDGVLMLREEQAPASSGRTPLCGWAGALAGMWSIWLVARYFARNSAFRLTRSSCAAAAAGPGKHGWPAVARQQGENCVTFNCAHCMAARAAGGEPGGAQRRTGAALRRAGIGWRARPRGRRSGRSQQRSLTFSSARQVPSDSSPCSTRKASCAGSKWRTRPARRESARRERAEASAQPAATFVSFLWDVCCCVFLFRWLGGLFPPRRQSAWAPEGAHS